MQNREDSFEEVGIDWDNFYNENVKDLQLADPVLKKLHELQKKSWTRWPFESLSIYWII